jgi:aldehyde:ferredoxin oxidoreductase
MEVHGYMGSQLHIDLSHQKIIKQPLDLTTAIKFLGGTGTASKMLYDRVGPEVDPFDPNNLLIIAVGPLVGTPAPAAARVEVASKSPLTGVLGLSSAGGYFAANLKMAGYDAIIIEGVSEKPVYLWINDGDVEIRSADHLWLKTDTWECVDHIKKDLGFEDHEVRVACIGPAGENLVRYASVVFDRYHVAGRCGLGAVMGAKRLKAIAVRGTKRPTIAKPADFSSAVREAVARMVNDPRYWRYHNYASFPVSRIAYKTGRLPGKNYQTPLLPDWEKTRTLEAALSYIVPQSRVDQKEIGCFSCPIMCFHEAEVREGKYAGLKISSGLHVQPVIEFGAKCAINNLPAIWKCKEICHRLGLDQTSAASCIAFAMELYQRKILSAKDIGMELEWGDEEAAFELLRMIAFRKGFGDVLAEGSYRAAKRVGKGSEEYAMTIKNMEMMVFDPRVGGRAWNLGCITSVRGGDNVRSTHYGFEIGEYKEGEDAKLIEWFDMPPDIKKAIFGAPPRIDEYTYVGKALLVKWLEDLTAAINALGVCLFASSNTGLGPTHYAKLYSSLTGIQLTPADIMLAGERIHNLQRAYAVREGITREHDKWPSRFYEEKIPEGPSQGAVLDKGEVDKVLDEYYRLRGWNAFGIPSEEKLRELELDDIVLDFKRRRIF